MSNQIYLSDNVIDTFNISSSTYNQINSTSSYYTNSLYNNYVIDSSSGIFRIIGNDNSGDIYLSNYNTSIIPTTGIANIAKVGTMNFDDYKIQEAINVYSNTLINLTYQVISEDTNYPIDLTNFQGTVVIQKYLSSQENFTFSPTVVYSKNSDLLTLDPVVYTSSPVNYHIIYENNSNPFFQLPSTKWSIQGMVDPNNEQISVEDTNILPIQYQGNLTTINAKAGIFNLSIPQVWIDPTFRVARNTFITPGNYLIEFSFFNNSQVYKTQLRFIVKQTINNITTYQSYLGDALVLYDPTSGHYYALNISSNQENVQDLGTSLSTPTISPPQPYSFVGDSYTLFDPVSGNYYQISISNNHENIINLGSSLPANYI